MDSCSFPVRFYLILPRPKIFPKGYPVNPQTIGEKIRKKRMDLGLFQKEVAEIIGVNEQTINNWETGKFSPAKRFKKRIERFLES